MTTRQFIAGILFLIALVGLTGAESIQSATSVAIYIIAHLSILGVAVYLANTNK